MSHCTGIALVRGAREYKENADWAGDRFAYFAAMMVDDGAKLSDNWAMPVFYKIDKERRLILSSGSGTFTLADARKHQERLVNDPDFDPSFSQIADFRHVTRFDISASEIQTLAEKSIYSAQSRRAFITPTEIGFGLARMFEHLRAEIGEEKIRVFRDLDAALDWVLSKDE